MTDPWTWVAAERHGIADLFEGLDAEQLASPSLCDGWTLQHLLGHLTMQLTYSPPAFASALLRTRFRFPKAIALITTERAALPTAELVATLRDQADKHWNPPGLGVSAPLTDLLVHGVDARYPLGIAHTADPGAVRHSLDFVQTRRAALGTFTRKGLADGLRLDAPDIGWTHGEGPTVSGPGVLLLAAVCNRPAVVDELSGDGVAVLRARLA